MKKNILLTTCAFTALSLFAPSAWAAAAAGTSADNGTTIGELVVTAERRETNLQDTPIAVSAFSADTLKSEKVNGGQDLLLQVPNTNYSRSNFGGFNLKIRGIGTDVIGTGGTAGVSINENELPVTVNNFNNTEFYDVDRVEVLRGPQGTLYGRNSTGGAVNIITTQPPASSAASHRSSTATTTRSRRRRGQHPARRGPRGPDRGLPPGPGRRRENTYLHQGRWPRPGFGPRHHQLQADRPVQRLSVVSSTTARTTPATASASSSASAIPARRNVGGAPTNATQQAFLTQGCLPGSLYQPRLTAP